MPPCPPPLPPPPRQPQAPAAFTPPASPASWSASPDDDVPDPAGRVDAVACVGSATGGRGPRLPPDEAERVEYLCALQVLDSPKDPRFDDITKLVREKEREGERGRAGVCVRVKGGCGETT